MGKVAKKPLVKPKTPSEQNLYEVATDVIEKCRSALSAKNLIKNNHLSTQKCSPKSSWDKVSEDIKKILNQLGKKSKPKKHPPKPIELKIEQKEFFKDQKNGTKDGSIEQYKEGGSFRRFGSSSNSGSVTTVPSSSIFKKVPVTRSEMQNFKRKVELTALESIKSPDLVKLIDKEKVVQNVNSLMKSNAIGSETKQKVPIVNVKKYIRRSLEMSSIPEDLEVVRKLADANRINRVLSDAGSVEPERWDEIYNGRTLEKDKTSSATKSTVPPSKTERSIKNSSFALRKLPKMTEKSSARLQKTQEISVDDRKMAGNYPNPQRDSHRRLVAAAGRCLSRSSSKFARNGSKASFHSYLKTPFKAEPVMRRCLDPISKLREEVDRAIKDKKTFTVSGHYPAVRNALVKRGWVEKYNVFSRDKLETQLSSLKNRTINQLADFLQVKDLNDVCRKLIKSKMLGSHQVDFYWGHNYDSFKINSDAVKLTKINRFRRNVFSYTSKQGLCEAAKDAHWFNFPGLAQINHPRTYVLSKNGETNDFVKDFRRTAAASLLKWIVRNRETEECKIVSGSGKVPLEAFRFACNECYKMVIEANNLDIDQPIKEATDKEWSRFLEYCYKILHVGNHFKEDGAENEESVLEKSRYLLEKLKPHHPHLRMDGAMNIWILKPAAGSQGKGIHICRTLQYIMNVVKNHDNQMGYIAQKYIERPLLIFNTKFDIRQWFLISCALPLTIWMYRECYLRFSSQTYNLRKLHESVHLTNNSVQKNYQNNSHDITLPRYNMWDSVQFKNYLSNIGYPEVYQKVVYKGMKECVVGAVMMHQDKMDNRKNCFELYGADFMITEDFQPWLIEINASPALFASTPITSRMCPQVLEDTIKVVVDHAADPRAKTGNFELIYRQPNVQYNNANNLKISGKPLPKNYFCLEEDKKSETITPLSITENIRLEKTLSKTKSEILAENVKKTLENLLRFIQTETKRRQKKKLVAKGTDPILPAKDSCSVTSTNMSLASLRSNLNVLASSSKINFTKEDENMLDQALKMLKSKRHNEVLKYLLDILERIANKSNLLG